MSNMNVCIHGGTRTNRYMHEDHILTSVIPFGLVLNLKLNYQASRARCSASSLYILSLYPYAVLTDVCCHTWAFAGSENLNIVTEVFISDLLSLSHLLSPHVS